MRTDECGAFVTNDSLTLNIEINVLQKQPDKELKAPSPSALECLLTSETGQKYSDLTIVIGEERIPVHRAVLATRSPVFAAMFDHSDGTLEGHSGQVVVSDIAVEVFRALLAFMYTGVMTVPLGQTLDHQQLVADLLVAADKYQVLELRADCAQWLGDHLTIEVVCQILVLADRQHLDQLKARCKRFIVDNISTVIKSSWWQEDLVKAKEADLISDILALAIDKN